MEEREREGYGKRRLMDEISKGKENEERERRTDEEK